MTKQIPYVLSAVLLLLLGAVLAYAMTLAKLTPRPPEPFSDEEITRMEIEVLEKSLEVFRSDVGRYPTSAEGLQALVENLGLPNWRGPYLQWTTVPLDSWGQPLHYRSSGGAFRVWSLDTRKNAGAGGKLDLPAGTQLGSK